MRFARFASKATIIVSLSAFILLPQGFAAETTSNGIDSIESRLVELLKEYYTKAKVTKEANKIHFEYKVRPFMTGNRQEMAPDFAGIMGDIELKPGRYEGKAQLPQNYNEYNFYSVILMAPYSSKDNGHFYTRLAYPPDAPPEFLDRFKDLVNETGDKVGTPVAAVKSTTAAAGETKTSSGTSGESKLFFWKARRGEDTVFLLGTIPFYRDDKNLFPLSGEIENAISSAKSIVVDTVDLRNALPYSAPTIRLNDGDQLSKHLSPSSRQAMNSFLAWSGETMDMYDFWKPWFAAVAFESSLFRLDGFRRIDWDKELLASARKASKPVVEVDSADAKIKIYDSLPEDVQNHLLQLSIHDLMDFKDTQMAMDEAWRDGDEEKMQTAVTRAQRANPQLLGAVEQVLDQRSENANSRIEEQLRSTKGPVFVSMDAKSLLGGHGLLARLRQKGFAVEQVFGSASGTVAKPPSPSAPDPIATFGGVRLSRYTYPEGKFSILLPGKPIMKFSNRSGMRQVEYIYPDTQGAYCVGYIILPSQPVPAAIPAAFEATSRALRTEYGTLEYKQSPASLQGYPGRIINITKIKGKPDWGVHVRMFVANRFLYILAAEGTSAWLRSPNVHKICNSLTLTTPGNELDGRYSLYLQNPSDAKWMRSEIVNPGTASGVLWGNGGETERHTAPAHSAGNEWDGGN